MLFSVHSGHSIQSQQSDQHLHEPYCHPSSYFITIRSMFVWYAEREGVGGREGKAPRPHYLPMVEGREEIADGFKAMMVSKQL